MAIKPDEKEIKVLMDKLDLTYEEAFQTWLEDNDYEENEEQNELDKKAKAVKIAHDCGNKTKGTSKPRTHKAIDEEIQLFDDIWTLISAKYGENASIVTQNKEIAVQINDISFSVKAIKHNKPKKA